MADEAEPDTDVRLTVVALSATVGNQRIPVSADVQPRQAIRPKCEEYATRHRLRLDANDLLQTLRSGQQRTGFLQFCKDRFFTAHFHCLFTTSGERPPAPSIWIG